MEDKNRRISWQPQPLHFSIMWLLGERDSSAREPADVRLHCPGGGSRVVAEGMSSEQPSPPSPPSAKAPGNSAVLSYPQSIGANSLWSILNKLQSQRDLKKKKRPVTRDHHDKVTFEIHYSLTDLLNRSHWPSNEKPLPKSCLPVSVTGCKVPGFQ